jgi:hypothetical protein
MAQAYFQAAQVGEAKWAVSVSGARLLRGLQRKAIESGLPLLTSSSMRSALVRRSRTCQPIATTPSW